ncbi:hypothetical protein KAU09_01290 [Candidatus Parcubacteria bacterium]|nr:hypothetical protein [Candidatus Parcubacteria bacterium]
MKRTKFSLVYICRDAVQKAIHEANKYYAIGKRKTGFPWEAAMYPLAHLVLKPGIHKSPLDFVELADIERIVVTHVFYPLDKFKDYSSHKAVFKKNAGASDYLNQVLSEYISRYPFLDVFCKQHSHPWSCSGWLSQGDLVHSVFNAYDWHRKKGLNTMFSFVMAPTFMQNTWKFNCFALRDNGKHVKLFVEIISRNHSYVREAKLMPYYKTNDGKKWCDQTKKKLITKRFQVSRNVLRRGWRRYTVKFDDNKYVICIPPFFPDQIVKIYKVVINDLSNPYHEIKLPNDSLWNRLGQSYKSYDIIKLINAIKERI